MKGRDRNAPCWCGSGKKYKKCHLDRERQPRDNPWTAIEAHRKAFTQKKCCAHGVGLGPCEGGIIKAHTVSRGPNLAKIAKHGLVLHYITKMKKNAGKLSVEKIGIKDASTFLGFCRKHDQELFSCIENEPFTGRPDQCLAVAYRTMSRELYGKDASSHWRETLRGGDKGMKIDEQLIYQRIQDEINMGNEAARQEFKATYDALTSALVHNRLDVLRSVVFELSAPLPFMFAGAWSPFSDLYGRELQSGYADELLDQVFISSFAGEHSGMICISWRDTNHAPGKVIADQIETLPVDQQTSACLQIFTKHAENVFFDPDWFQSLDEKQREQLDILAASGLDPMKSIPTAPVRLDIDFKLPTVFRSFHV